MMFATSLALIAQAFHGKERGIAFGVFGGVIGAAVAVGPVRRRRDHLGHRLGMDLLRQRADRHRRRVPRRSAQVSESRDPNATGVDWVGLMTFSGSLFLLVFALIQGNEKGWGSTRDLSLPDRRGGAVGAVPDRRAPPGTADARPDAVPPAGVRRREHRRVLRCPASMFAMFLYLTLYIQDVLGYGPLQAGLRFLPITLLVVRRRADLGQAQRARTGAPAARRRAAARRAAGCWR